MWKLKRIENAYPGPRVVAETISETVERLVKDNYKCEELANDMVTVIRNAKKQLKEDQDEKI